MERPLPHRRASTFPPTRKGRWLQCAVIGAICACASTPEAPTTAERFHRAVAELRRSDTVESASWEVPGQRTMPWEIPRLVPVLSSACRAGIGEACGVAHWWYTFGPVSVQDRQKAEVHLRRGLMLSDPLSVYLGALGEPFEEARPLFVDACERGVGYSCAWVGDRMDDTVTRMRLLRRGCELRDATSCGLYAVNHVRRFRSLRPSDRTVVLQLAQSACDDGSLLSCVALAKLRNAVGQLGTSLSTDYVERVFGTVLVPPGVVLRFPGWAARTFRVPDHGYIRAFRDGTGSRVRSLAQSDVAVSNEVAVRLSIYVASPTNLGRLALSTSREMASTCPLEIQTRERQWTLRPVRRRQTVSAKVPVRVLFQLAKPDTHLVFCGRRMSTYSLRLHAWILEMTREVLLGRLPREDWAPH